jgi:hypothetical protein
MGLSSRNARQREGPKRKTGLNLQASVTQVGDHIWLVTCMHYDLGYFDNETCRLEPIANPFGPKVLPVRSE